MTAPALLREYPRADRPARPRIAADRELAVGSPVPPSVLTPRTADDIRPLAHAYWPAPAFRTPVDGPEGRLVDAFVAWCADRIGAVVPRGCMIALLREPRLPSGFPDLVFVVWHERTAAKWRAERACLTAGDFQLLQYLREVGGAQTDDLATWGDARVHVRLDRLHGAGLVWRRGRQWRPRALTESFAARSIIAVEAKVSQWAAALDQAAVNTWFASQSFVLLPHAPAGSGLLTRAAVHGVGVWVANGPTPAAAPYRLADAPRHALPRSYASWLVNEWVCRAVHAGWPPGQGGEVAPRMPSVHAAPSP